MEKVKCGDCKDWDRENIEKLGIDGNKKVLIAKCTHELSLGVFVRENDDSFCQQFMEVEPEVYEVECVWNGATYECSGRRCVAPASRDEMFFSAGKGLSLKGKRTKLTIEVLD